MKVYIAGPIAGKPFNNVDAFRAAAYHLLAAGHVPVNPHDVKPVDHDGSCPAGPVAGEDSAHNAPCFMRTDLIAMLGCEAIYLLDGWELSSSARTEFEAARAAGLKITYQSSGIDVAHLERQRDFSRATFGPGQRTLGVLDHIRKELAEIEADPDDLMEWVDVIILAFDGAWRAGWEPDEIINAVKKKQYRNEQRTWPDWRTASEDKAIEHDRSTDDDPGCVTCGRDNRNGTHSALERTGHLSHPFKAGAS